MTTAERIAAIIADALDSITSRPEFPEDLPERSMDRAHLAAAQYRTLVSLECQVDMARMMLAKTLRGIDPNKMPAEPVKVEDCYLRVVEKAGRKRVQIRGLKPRSEV